MDNKSLDDMDKASFKIGDVSKALNLAPQTIRYFEDQGLILPIRDPENNHRYYSIYDVYKMTLRQQYKNIEISVTDTEKILNMYDTRNIIDLLEKQKKKLEREQLLSELRVISLEKFRDRIERIVLHLDRHFFMSRPPIWKTPHMVNKRLVSEAEQNYARQMAIDLMPLSTYTFQYNWDEGLPYSISSNRDKQSELNGNWDISIQSPYAERIGFDEISTTEFVPEEKNCIYTIIKQKETNYFNLEGLQPAFDFITDNQLSINGNIYGNIIISSYNENGEYERYFEIWIPVTDN